MCDISEKFPDPWLHIAKKAKRYDQNYAYRSDLESINSYKTPCISWHSISNDNGFLNTFIRKTLGN